MATITAITTNSKAQSFYENIVYYRECVRNVILRVHTAAIAAAAASVRA